MIYSRIAEQRKKLGLSQEELAAQLKISQKSISKYERGDRRPSYEILTAMSSIFGVSIDYLLGNNLSDNSAVIHNTENRTNDTSKEKYFFFFFDEENNLRTVFTKRIKTALLNIGMTEEDFTQKISIGQEKASSFLNGEGEPTADDLIELSHFLDTSIDYLLGQTPRISIVEKKLLNAFASLNTDNKDILIGKAKELLKEQKYESVAADESLKKTGTTNSGK